MPTKVKTPYATAFNMPSSCVACGAAPGTGKKRIEASKSSGSARTTLALDFPLCQECYEVNRDAPAAKLVGALGLLFSAILCSLTSYFVAALANWYIGLLLGGTLLLTGALITRWVSNLISEQDMTEDQKRRRRSVRRSAKIASFKTPGVFAKGSVSFIFENPAFAHQFSSMNLGNIT